MNSNAFKASTYHGFCVRSLIRNSSTILVASRNRVACSFAMEDSKSINPRCAAKSSRPAVPMCRMQSAALRCRAGRSSTINRTSGRRIHASDMAADSPGSRVAVSGKSMGSATICNHDGGFSMKERSGTGARGCLLSRATVSGTITIPNSSRSTSRCPISASADKGELSVMTIIAHAVGETLLQHARQLQFHQPSVRATLSASKELQSRPISTPALATGAPAPLKSTRLHKPAQPALPWQLDSDCPSVRLAPQTNLRGYQESQSCMHLIIVALKTQTEPYRRSPS